MEFAPEFRLIEHENALEVDNVAAEELQVTATPDNASVALPVITSAGLVTVTPLCGELITSTGGVSSSLTIAEALAVLPALSSAVPEIILFALSADTVTGAGQVSIPLPPSVQVK